MKYNPYSVLLKELQSLYVRFGFVFLYVLRPFLEIDLNHKSRRRWADYAKRSRMFHYRYQISNNYQNFMKSFFCTKVFGPSINKRGSYVFADLDYWPSDIAKPNRVNVQLNAFSARNRLA